MGIDEANRPSKKWFIGLVCFALLSTYLPIAIPSILPLLVFIFGLALAFQTQKLGVGTWLKCLYYVSIIVSVVLSQREYIFIIIAALLLHSTFEIKDAFSLSCILTAPLLFITEILAYWGLPFTTWLIMYWGLPFLILSYAIVLLSRNNTKLSLYIVLFAGILLISNTFLLYNNRDANIKIVKAAHSSDVEGASYNIIKNLSDSSTLVNQDDA